MRRSFQKRARRKVGSVPELRAAEGHECTSRLKRWVVRIRTFHMSSREPHDDEEGDRTTMNIILVVGFAVLVGGGIWLATAMIDARKADECMSSGRRNCNPIEAPAR